MSKMNMYKELIDLFMEAKYLSFRVVVADKSYLDYESFGLSHDDWYYRMYYNLLSKTLENKDMYYIFIDIKDTRSKCKVKKLHEVLRNSYVHNTINKIQQIRSHESELMQLCDLFIGAASYRNAGYTSSKAKIEIINYLFNKTKQSLRLTSPLSEKKFNIFVWEGKRNGM